ncbi:MAG: hypothetical protein R3A52_19785 [Polyangiales bacterium]
MPRETLFSWTSHGPWMLHEWLAAVVAWAAHRAGGWWGVGALQAILYAGALSSRGSRARLASPSGPRPLPSGYALVPLALAAVVLRETVSPRAQWFTNLLLALSLATLLPRAAVDEEPPWRRDALWWVIPLGLLWTQLHGGAPHLVVVTGAVFVARPSPRTLLAAIASVALTMAGPYGWRVHEHFLSARPLLPELREWWPLSRALAARWPPAYVALGLAALAVVSLVARARAGRRVRAEALVFAVFAVMAARHLRFVAELCVVSSAVAAAGLSRLRVDPKRELIAALVALTAVVVGASRDGRAWGAGWSDKFDPRVAALLRDPALTGPMFNSYNLGGWLIWEAPSRPVFIDGRAFTAYPASRVAEMVAVVRDPPRVASVVDRWGANLAVLTRAGRGDPVARALARSPEWAVVYVSPSAAVLRRRETRPAR